MTDELLEQVILATEAIEAIQSLRERQITSTVEAGVPPDRDSTLAKAEYHVRGVRDELVGQLGTEEAVDVIEGFEEGEGDG